MRDIASEIFIFIIFLVLIIGTCFRGCWVSSKVAVNAMEAAGYSNVHVTATHWLAPGLYGCDEKDAVGFDVTADNPVGKHINATVCSGVLFKGATIRFKN